jgi:hypothetical protein
MAVSPNSPDYVSQVRGIISDLRQDYISQMQLYQNEQRFRAEQEAKNEANFLQLAQSMAALNSQNQLARKQMDDNRFIGEQKIAADKQQNENEMAFKFTQEYAKSELNRQNQEKENTASALEQEFRLAESSGDQNKVNDVLNKIGQASLASAQRTQIYNNVYNTLGKMKEWEQTTNNIKTSTLAKNMINDLQNLDPIKFTPIEYEKQKNTIAEQFSALNNNDPILVRSFFDTQDKANAKFDDYKKSKIGESVTNFIAQAERPNNFLSPTIQARYNELKNDPQKYTAAALQGLAFEANSEASRNTLQGIDQGNVKLLDQVAQNPQYAGRDFSKILPDLTPVVSYNGNIDPDTGLLTKQFVDRQKAFDDDIRRPSFILGQDLTMQQAIAKNMPPVNLGGANLTPQGSGAGRPLEQKGGQVVSTPKVQSVSRFEIAQPGTATIPVAPKAQPIKISDATKQFIAETYQKNPNAVLNGRPVREIIAALKAQNQAIPPYRSATSVVSPGAQYDGSGQNR